MSDRDLQEYQDLIRKHEDAYAAGLAAGRARADEAVALVAQLTRECDKERQRGDTYRARALALLKRAQYLRKERDANDGLQDVIGMICRQRDAARLQLVATEGVVVNTRQALENTASQWLDSGVQLAAERRARESAESELAQLKAKMARIYEPRRPYSDECNAAIVAIENKYTTDDKSVELVSIQHHAKWVDIAEAAEARAAGLERLLRRAIAHVNYRSNLYNEIDAALSHPDGAAPAAGEQRGERR